MLISIVVEHSALACSEAAEDTASTLIIVTTDNRGLPRLSLFPFSSKLIICWLSCHASSMELLEAVSTVISSKNRFIFHLDDAFLALQRSIFHCHNCDKTIKPDHHYSYKPSGGRGTVANGRYWHVDKGMTTATALIAPFTVTRGRGRTTIREPAVSSL